MPGPASNLLPAMSNVACSISPGGGNDSDSCISNNGYWASNRNGNFCLNIGSAAISERECVRSGGQWVSGTGACIVHGKNVNQKIPSSSAPVLKANHNTTRSNHTTGMKRDNAGDNVGTEKTDGSKYRKLKSEKQEFPTDELDPCDETLNGCGGLSGQTGSGNTVPVKVNREEQR